jgi:ABC-type branched-subunit amino acid transport system substrate-binding protein
MTPRRLSLVALLVAAAVTSSGCSVADTIAERFAPDTEVGTPTVTIAVLVPMSGGQTRNGMNVLASVKQAVADAGGVPGWEVVVREYDVTSPTLDEELAEIEGDDTTVSVITGFGPDDIRTIVPRLDDAGLSIVSPADSDPRHVRGADPANPIRPWSGYVTVAVDPDPEESALADHLVRVDQVETAVVIDDGTSPSAERAASIVTAFRERGVLDVTEVSWDGSAVSRALRASVRDLAPGDALVVDGSPQLVAATRALAADGVVVAMAEKPAELTAGEAGALQGVLAPQSGRDPARGSTELEEAFAAAGTPVTVGPFGPAAYDGARTLVDVYSRCLPDPTRSSSPSRSTCRTDLAGTTWDGLTGPIQFDEFGARLELLPAVVSLKGDSWGQPGA